MMKKVISILLTVGVVALVFSSHESAAQVEPKFQIISNKLVEKVVGVNNATFSIKDIKKGMCLILSLMVTCDTDMVFHNTDFQVKYKNHGEESTSRCTGIMTSTSSQNEEGAWLVGTYANIKVKKGVRYIKLAFESVETEVKTVNLDYSIPVIKNISIR